MRAKRFISVILSLLIICSSFAGLTVFADEADYTVESNDKVSTVSTEYYIAGEAGLCNGVSWNQKAEINKMNAVEDGSYEITITNVQPKEDGSSYQFKVTTNGQWEPAYGYNGLIIPGSDNAQLMITEANSTVKIILTKDLYVQAYVNGIKVSPDTVTPTEIPIATTDTDGNTSGITYGGGFFYPPQGVECNRYFFQMPVNVVDDYGDNHNWKTFNNATATCYWWDGEYACESWQKSYQMKASGLDNIYYIDVPTNVYTVIFNNGIDGEFDKKDSPNKDKCCQTVNVCTEYYEPGENPNYPNGTTTFNNMIYIVDVNNDIYGDYSNPKTTYGGEWRYLHSDGTIDYTAGTIYEPKGIKVSADINEFSLAVDESVKANATVTGGDIGYTVEWTSSDTSVADVDQYGTITAKGAGTAEITVKAQNPDNELDFSIDKISVTVTLKEQTVSVSKTSYIKVFGAKPFNLYAKAETALSYVSSNPKVAYVSADGAVTIKGAGTATITITAEEAGNYKSATATVKITVAKATQRVTGVKTQYVTKAGKSFILKPKAKNKLTYTSSNKNVAVVSSTGKVTVKTGGYAYITVKASENGNYKSAYVKTKIISAPKDFTSKDVSKVKKTGKKTAKITWKSLASAKGYTVQLATNKTFKGAKTVKNSKNTANFTNLKKGKTYYVRINAYTKVSGKNYSNKWYTVKFKM